MWQSIEKFAKKWAWINIITVSNLIMCVMSYSNSQCNKFHITVNREPEFYIPRSTYIVGIESNDVHTFKSFYLTAEFHENDMLSSKQPGWFSLMSEDNEVQFSPDAINTIIERSNSPKQSVHALWTAPFDRDCLWFKAEVNYDFDNNNCSQKIEKKICALAENTSFRKSFVSDDDECCACDEASYIMIFEGLWSQQTHPKDFPSTLQLTHFSDIIGCTHSKNITMWAEGQYASEGLRQVAEFGSSSIMESELLDKKSYLRSLIKIPGLWYPKMNSNATKKFRVDRQHNLLSLASMLGPSPDWFTGISKMNLCTRDCSWIENLTVDLPLFDAGTDNGISYMSPNAPTIPQEPVYRITSSYPEDPRAPFYEMHGGPIQPIARLYFKRERIFPKSCFEESSSESDREGQETEKRPECVTTNYTEWSPCSASCGSGMQARIRTYVNAEQAKLADCKVQLMETKFCTATISCPGEPDDDPLLLPDEICKTTNWSEWSECTATCGIGLMTRTRKFLNKSGFKKCKHISVYETKKCMEPPCKTTSIEKVLLNCTTTEWSDWSPCSATCGQGKRIRIRHLLNVPKILYSTCKSSVKLEERRECVRTENCTPDKARAKDICSLIQLEGPCRGQYERWFYDSKTKKCTEFSYGGCRGNENNFFTLDECIRICSGV